MRRVRAYLFLTACLLSMLTACAAGPEFSVVMLSVYVETIAQNTGYAVQSNTALRINVTNTGDRAATNVVATPCSTHADVFLASGPIRVGDLAPGDGHSPKELLLLYVNEGHDFTTDDIAWSFAHGGAARDEATGIPEACRR